MKLLTFTALLLASFAPYTEAAKPTIQKVRIFIQPQDGFESYIAAAIIKKEVPAVVTQNEAEADFSLTSTVTTEKESTGGKIARCAFMYCIGINGTQTATVQLVMRGSKDVAWAYNVRKGGNTNFQSSAEAIAKHLKQFLEKKSR